MAVLSRDIQTVDSTDYNDISIQQLQLTPKFDDVIDGFVAPFPVGYNIEDAKSIIKAKMTERGVTRDSEI